MKLERTLKEMLEMLLFELPPESREHTLNTLPFLTETPSPVLPLYRFSFFFLLLCLCFVCAQPWANFVI